MELESYFNFLSEDDIRVKGTRIGIEIILDGYLEGSSPEEIAARHRSLSLEQVYATITYYLHDREKVDAYLKAWYQYTEQTEQEYDRNPPELAVRLRERIKNYQRTVLAEERIDYLTDEPMTTLENYLNFLNEDDIRIKGTRIGIETVLDDYLEGSSPEEIAARYRSLSLEKVYATITYYLRNRAKVDQYLDAWRQYTDQAYEASKRHPSAVVRRLRQLKDKPISDN